MWLFTRLFVIDKLYGNVLSLSNIIINKSCMHMFVLRIQTGMEKL